MPGNGAAAQVEATAVPSAFWEAPAEGERALVVGEQKSPELEEPPTKAPLAPALHHGQIDDVIRSGSSETVARCEREWVVVAGEWWWQGSDALGAS